MPVKWKASAKGLQASWHAAASWLYGRGRTARPRAATHEKRDYLRRNRQPSCGQEGRVAIQSIRRCAVHIDCASDAEWAVVVAERSLGRRARKCRSSAMTAQRERDEGWVLCGSDSWTRRSNRERKALQGKRIGKPTRDDAPYTPLQNFCHGLRARIAQHKIRRIVLRAANFN
jgi:hypothetical protein